MALGTLDIVEGLFSSCSVLLPPTSFLSISAPTCSWLASTLLYTSLSPVYTSILVCFLLPNTTTKSHVGRKRLISAYRLQSTIEGNQNRNSSRNWGSEREGTLAGSFPGLCSVIFLMQTICPRNNAIHSGLTSIKSQVRPAFSWDSLFILL